MKKDGVIINDELSDPLGDNVIDFLLSQSKETPFHDFKSTLDIGKNSTDFPKIIKDIFAFTNAGGGFLVLGVKPNDHVDKEIKGSFIKTGLPENFEIESASLQEKINSYMDKPLEILYAPFEREVNGEKRKFALIYIPPSFKIMTPIKDGVYNIDGKEKKAFTKEQILIRRGTQSVPASQYEIYRMNKRLEDENYRLSLLTGEPDKVEETLLSNLFEVKKLPKFVYIGTAKFKNGLELQGWLDKEYPDARYFFFRVRHHEDKIVSFQNLENTSNFHHHLVYPDEIKKEPIENWLDSGPKERIITSLLNKEVAGKGKEQEMRYFVKHKKLFYHTVNDERKVSWPSRYKGVSSRIVAKKIWAEQLGRSVFWHAAIQPTFTRLNDKFYLKIALTSIITEDGKKVSTGMKEGTVITRKSFNTFNNQYLNNILFWINKLGDGTDIKISDDLVISVNPVETKLDTGISWDIPTSTIKEFIEEFKPEEEQSEEEGEEENEF
ncbi:helix-turn-helix domain-containing protein [Candidatus Nitrosotenuis cloacae]|uniref:Schlafen AlbA-2 domain-containing protein n=1 Tax=Candidatus Nitrosotenuis cloacae TaxID=1603555 RepID=A0A3G1B2U8_9ARCH|nr:ATP-binding protein [Candidatus Nitrosotenuis cloacae]AJZ76193.1 hypothetical protein SU86_007260 [Candidatus Nitrosotenuis cloacae]